MTTAQANFWIVFTTAAATLAGFTLASYSIFITRIEIAAADAICRRYLFKECTSQFSLAFILFALTMFVVPMGLGLFVLFPVNSIDGSWRVAIQLIAFIVAFSFLSIVAIINWRQFSYCMILMRYKKNLTVKSPVRSSRRSSDRLHAVMACVMLIFSWVIMAVNFLHLALRLERAGVWTIDISFLDKAANRFPAEFGATASLFLGLALVGWHFYLFEPARLVFKADDDTKSMLQSASTEIERAWELVVPLRDWLKTRICNAKLTLDRNGAAANAESNGAKLLLSRAEAYLDGRSPGLKGEEGDTLVGRQKYHFDWIKFCHEQEVMTFGDIVWIMNGIDLYLKALVNFEQRLKEMPAQLTILVDPLNPGGSEAKPIRRRAAAK